MIVWPTGLRYASAAPSLAASWRGGGPALSGQEQRIYGDLGPWRVVVESIHARTPDQIAAAQAMLTRLRAGELLAAPVCEHAPPVAGTTATAALAEAAALRATSLSIVTSGATLRLGALIGLGDRVHRVVEILSAPTRAPLRNQLVHDDLWRDDMPWVDVEEVAASRRTYVVRVLPSLREAAPAGAVVALSDLRLRTRLADAEAGVIGDFAGRTTVFSLSLVESF